jgi:DNA ligase-1
MAIFYNSSCNYLCYKDNIMIFKPMLAATVTDRAKLHFPYLASPKLDGIRCLIIGGQVLSRSFKPIRNKHIAACLAGLPDMDGELIVGAATEGDVFNRTTRGVMTASGAPDFTYHAFDTLKHPTMPFHARLSLVQDSKYVKQVLHTTVSTLNALAAYEAQVLAQGYEGVMLRGIYAQYKHGRATPLENSLWKLKQFMDGEILVTAVLEGVENMNPATKDALGETTRSMHKENMVPNGKVGTIIGTDLQTGQLLEISPGKMTHDERRFYWVNQHGIIGKVVKYKAFGYGSLNVARFATYQGFRDLDDIL